MWGSKVVQSAEKRKPPAAGKGRAKGVPNKITKQLKDMILGALDDAGGQAYLTAQAKEAPAAFMALLGKVLPSEIKAEHTGPGGGPIQAEVAPRPQLSREEWLKVHGLG